MCFLWIHQRASAPDVNSEVIHHCRYVAMFDVTCCDWLNSSYHRPNRKSPRLPARGCSRPPPPCSPESLWETKPCFLCHSPGTSTHTSLNQSSIINTSTHTSLNQSSIINTSTHTSINQSSIINTSTHTSINQSSIINISTHTSINQSSIISMKLSCSQSERSLTSSAVSSSSSSSGRYSSSEESSSARGMSTNCGA